jgi:DNA (cytosine-5)-methyltransferase 1
MWLPCHKRLDKEKKRGAESIYGRMRWNTPSPTITTRSIVPACGRFVHPSQNRGITLREAARLQSIPDDFHIVGSKERVGQWIGNAFPMALAESLGRQAIIYA